MNTIKYHWEQFDELVLTNVTSENQRRCMQMAFYSGFMAGLVHHGINDQQLRIFLDEAEAFTKRFRERYG